MLKEINNSIDKRFDLFLLSVAGIIGGILFFWIYYKDILKGISFHALPLFIEHILLFLILVLVGWIITVAFGAILTGILLAIGVLEE